MSGQPHRNFAVKKFPGTGALCAAIWRPKIFWNKSHGCSSLQSSAQAFGEVGLGKAIGPPQRTGQAARVDAELGRQAWPSARFVTKARGAKPLQNRDPVPWQPWAGALFNLSKRPRPGDRAGTIAEWA